MCRVMLLSLPFGALERQALGLSLLKARLADEGIDCELRYLTFSFADLVGVEEYCWITTDLPHTAFAGEWVFRPCLYGRDSRAEATYVREVLKGHWHMDDRTVSRLRRAQEIAPFFIEHWFQAIRWGDYAIVGFTSTFEQNIASLALARRIKAEYPEVNIVLGGANWEGDMGLELHRRFEFVDFVCSGEAEDSFPRLVKLVLRDELDKRACSAIPGLIYRDNRASVLGKPPEPVAMLDALPYPDFSDYFRDFDQSSASTLVVPSLLFEGARGCWWGAKKHCLFCGLNGANLAFRAKSSGRALAELNYLVDRWKTNLVQAVDNVIPMEYFDELFPALAARARPLQMFYEIRANLSRAQIQALGEAGITHVQPGIESFNNHVLRLMSKGTRALDNVQTLKWCKEMGVQADYNILYGFPGEKEEDYDEMFRILEAIRFMGAPTGCGPIRLDRFSPLFENADGYGLTGVDPVKPYYILYPFGDASVRRIAYYFDYQLPPEAVPPGRSEELVSRVNQWKASPEPGALQAFERPDGTLALLDTRSYAVCRSIVLRGIDRDVYEFCDRARSLTTILGFLADRGLGVAARKTSVRAFLDALVDHGFMLRDESRYLSLALRAPSSGGGVDRSVDLGVEQVTAQA